MLAHHIMLIPGSSTACCHYRNVLYRHGTGGAAAARGIMHLHVLLCMMQAYQLLAAAVLQEQ
jgi:hypothetical protein